MPLTNPSTTLANRVLVNTTSHRHSVGMMTAAIGGTPASTTWPAANRAIYVPIYLDQPAICNKLFVQTGSTASGNIDIGVYNSAFAKLVSIGATVSGSGGVIQEFDVTDTLLPRGVLYLGISMSSGTGTLLAWSGGNAGIFRAWGILQEASAHPLPSTATPVANTGTFLPIAGIAFRTVVL